MNEDWRRQSIVVTGSSGSGKSTVCRYFAELGAVVLSADDFARQALSPPSPALEQVRTRFGGQFFQDGVLDRKALGRHIFANPEARKSLEAIVHPIVRNLAAEEFARRNGSIAPLVIYDCPLFFEANLGRENYRAVLVVTAPLETRLSRIMSRDNISREEALLRLQNQLPDELKKGDEVIQNDQGTDALKMRVEELFNRYRRNASGGADCS